jgi:PAS domain-containing protein
MEINVVSILLVLVPLFLNLVLGAYILLKIHKDDQNNVFLLFLGSLISWQLLEVLIRLRINEESKFLIDSYLCFGWIFLGAFLLHFTVLLVRSPLKNRRLFFVINYGVTFIFYLLYINYPEPVAFSYHPFFSDIPVTRPGSPDTFKRAWIILQVFSALFIMGYFIKNSLRQKRQLNRVRQVRLVFIGVLIPAIEGFFTQWLLPLFGVEDIAITATSMTTISVFTFYGMVRYNLFNYFEHISFEEVLKKMKSVMVLFDSNLNVLLQNEYTSTITGVEISSEINLRELLDDKSRLALDSALKSQSKLNELIELLIKNKEGNEIPVEVSVHKIGVVMGNELFLLLGNDIRETFQYKQKLMVFNKYFKFFLEASNESFFELNPSTKEISWNDTEFKIFGEEKIELLYSFTGLERFFNDANPNWEFVKLKNWIYGMNRKPISLFFNFKKCNGEHLYLSLNAIKVINDQKGNYRVIGTVRDTSSEYEYFKKVAEKDVILREIAWIQSHRVRAPLANILGLVWMLKTDRDIELEERNELLDALELSAEELDNVLKDIVNKANEIDA